MPPTQAGVEPVASLPMRRPALLLAVVLLAACGGGDDDTSSIDASTTNVPGTEATEPATVPDAFEGCEDVPDPADYPEGEIPPTYRPCTLPTELVVATIRTGTGRAAEAGDTLIVDYTGIRSEDGTVFDTSYVRDVPLDFPLGRGGVIAGWDQGLVGAQAGSLIKLDIPNELAYGDTPPGDQIQPGDDLTFIVEVRAVVPPVTAEDAPLDLDIEPSDGATEVTVTDLEIGDGAPIELGDTAVVHVLLVRGDNKIVLFNTWERDDPLQIVMEEGNTLPGMFEGLQGATVGSLRVITIPPEDAFGPEGEPSLGLPAGKDLIVVADVVGVY